MSRRARQGVVVQSVCLDRRQPWPGRPRSKRSQGVVGRPASFAAGPRSAPTAALRAPSSPVDWAAVPWSWAGIESARAGRVGASRGWRHEGGATNPNKKLPRRRRPTEAGAVPSVLVVLPAAWAARTKDRMGRRVRGPRSKSIDRSPKKGQGRPGGRDNTEIVARWLQPAQEGRLTTAHRRSRRAAIIEGCWATRELGVENDGDTVV